jgi:cytidylate kinase
MEKKKRFVIAIDGPAGVGKSTIGQLVAKSLGYHFVNTGEMYRALTWKALENNLDVGDENGIVSLAKKIKWEFRPSSDQVTLKTFIDGEPVSVHIREEKVGAVSSQVASYPGVRRFLCRLQRQLGGQGGVVMEGRDITTHVFPDADFKIYLDASVEERAKRRYHQLKASGQSANWRKIKEAILKRDLGDLKRKINPLTCAKDAVMIDSTRMSRHSVARYILKMVRPHKASKL